MAALLRALVALAAVQTVLSAPAAQGVSKSSRCGASFGHLTCQGSSFGNCCSQYNYCGSSSDHCSADKGCQAGYGTCSPATTKPSKTPKISTDGKCGGDKGATCLGSKYGDCCSQYNWCGSTAGYCEKGCNPLFGKCSTPKGSSTPPAPARSSTIIAPSSLPSPGLVVSSNARCGSAHGASPKGMTCRGSKFGNCCSKYSYCGSTDSYCGVGCQPGFGDCKAKSSSLPTPSQSPTPFPAPSSSSSPSKAPSSASSSSSASSAASSTSSFPMSVLGSSMTPSSSTPLVSSSSSSDVQSSVASSTELSSSSAASSTELSSSSAAVTTSSEIISSTVAPTTLSSSSISTPVAENPSSTLSTSYSSSSSSMSTSVAETPSSSMSTSYSSSSSSVSSASSSVDVVTSSELVSSTASSIDVSSSSATTLVVETPSSTQPALSSSSSSADTSETSITSSATSSIASSTLISTTDAVTSTLSSSEVFSSTTISSSEMPTSTVLPSSTVASSSAAPSATSLLLNFGFEATSPEGVIWKTHDRGAVANKAIFDFMVPSSVTAPYSGSQVASITMPPGTNDDHWFTQPITLKPSTKYNFSAQVKSSTTSAACIAFFYIGTPDGSNSVPYGILNVVQSVLPITNWRQITGTFTSVTAAATQDISFSIRMRCTTSSPPSEYRAFFFDEVLLNPA